MKAVLRPLNLKDVDNVMSWVNDKEVIGNFAGFSVPVSRDKEEEYIKGILNSTKDKVFAVEDSDGVYLGNVGLHQIDWPSRAARLAIILGNKKYQGKGYGQLALKELLRMAFDEYNLHKVWVVCFKTNEKTSHIMKKVGFKEEGILRDEYFHKGKYHDMIRFSMIEDEWRKQK